MGMRWTCVTMRANAVVRQLSYRTLLPLNEGLQAIYCASVTLLLPLRANELRMKGLRIHRCNC